MTILVVSMHCESLAGHSPVDVNSSWHEFACKCSARPAHVWLTVSGVGTVRLHTLNGLQILNEPVHSSHDMNEYGQIVAEATALAALRRWLGHRIDHVSLLHQGPPNATVGMVLHFHEGSVGIADLGDELIVDEWPGSKLGAAGSDDEPPELSGPATLPSESRPFGQVGYLSATDQVV